MLHPCHFLFQSALFLQSLAALLCSKARNGKFVLTGMMKLWAHDRSREVEQTSEGVALLG